MEKRKIALVTSPISLLGMHVARQLAHEGYDLLFITWRSDLAEKLMHDILTTYDIRIMIIRHDLGLPASIESVKRAIKRERFYPQLMVRIPLIEENTSPAKRGLQDTLTTLREIENNFDLLSQYFQKVEKISYKVLTVNPQLDFLVRKHSTFWISNKYGSYISFVLKSILNLLTSSEADNVAKTVVRLSKYREININIRIWYYVKPLIRLFLVQLGKLIKEGKKLWQ